MTSWQSLRLSTNLPLRYFLPDSLLLQSLEVRNEF